MTFTIAMPALWIILTSAALFIGVTALTIWQGMWDGGDPYGVGAMFICFIYMVLWALPSLIIWAVWATWFK